MVEDHGIVRDDKGRFVTRELDSDTARDMQAKRWTEGRNKIPTILLREAGYNDDNPAPEHLKVLAEIASSQKASAVSAMRDFLKLTGKQDTPASPGKPVPGTLCPLCGELVFKGYRPDDRQLQEASEYLDRGNGTDTKV